MFITIMQWLAFFLYVLIFVAAIIFEIRWLTKKQWATSGRATGYVITTDLLGVGIGSVIVMTIFFGMFMMVMGPKGAGSDVPEYVYWICLFFAIILPPIILTAIKRLFLVFFSMGSGKAAWTYSVASSVAMVLVVVIPPPIMYYALDFLDRNFK